MATSPISLLPETQDLNLYGGDGVELRITVNDAGGAVPLTGTVDAQIRASRVNPAKLADFAADLSQSASGIVILSLTGAQTAALHGLPGTPAERFTGVWDVQWTPTGEEPITLLQGAVESNLDVTRLP
jgi:hypothetical protein